MDAVVYNEIVTQVGKRTDAADATGSLHAKTTDIKNVVATIIPGTPFHTKLATITTCGISVSGTVPETVMSITGPRVFLGGQIVISRNSRLLITIDGVNYEYAAAGEKGDRLDIFKGMIPIFGHSSGDFLAATLHLNGPFKFASSFVIQFAEDDEDVLSTYIGATVTHIAV